MKNKNIYMVDCESEHSDYLILVLAHTKKEAEKIALQSLENGKDEFKVQKYRNSKCITKFSTTKDFLGSGVIFMYENLY